MINKDESLFVVDENDNPLTPSPRINVHKRGFWHRTSSAWIINSNYQILCGKRSKIKDADPGKWQAFFGGHVGSNESYEQGLRKELNEELSLNINEKDFNFWAIIKNKPYKEFQAVYYLRLDSRKFKFEQEEIEEIKWLNLSELKKIVHKRHKDWAFMGFEKDFIEHIEMCRLPESNR